MNADRIYSPRRPLLVETLTGIALIAAPFILPYFEAAKARGEVAADLDERAASEWIARMFMSLTVMPGSVAFDASKPKSFRAFLERYAIDGLAPHPKRAKRKAR